MRALEWIFCAGLVSGVGVGAQSPSPAAFALKQGDTVVMYGYSITAQNLYTQYVELSTATRKLS